MVAAPLVFRPSSPSDSRELGCFLKRNLARDGASPGFEEPGLSWKYWLPRDNEEGSRSYVLAGNEGIEAHCGVLPARLHCGHGRTRVAHFIDWAADPRTFGAGVRLLRKIAAFSGKLMAIGGSTDTRKILPLMGFGPANEAVFFARPVRPFRQAFKHQQRDWRLPARVVRNALWATFPIIKKPVGWSIEPISPTAVPAELWSPHASPWPTRERSSFVYAHYLACPFMRFQLFLIHLRQRPVGCILIGFALGQARVADVWVIEPSPECYEAAYRLALVASLTDPTVVEVIALASIPWRLDALQRCGFREFRRESIMVCPFEDVPSGGFDCQLLDNDTAFLTFSAPSYVT
jgi:hypothetical protein